MSIKGTSLHSISEISEQDVNELFARAQYLKKATSEGRGFKDLVVEDASRYLMAVLFFESSTRTRLSFQVAANRLGMRAVVLDSLHTSSIAKGESYVDTARTVEAMQPDVMVVRHGDTPGLDAALRSTSCIVINAGSGISEHPTQALLDAFTIKEAFGEVAGRKVLIVGDIAHSRVANSNFSLLTRLGAEISVCGPEEMLPAEGPWASVKHFDDLDEGMKWADVCMTLRIQKERHSGEGVGLSLARYRERYGINVTRLGHLKPNGIVMHPGPVIYGVDLTTEVLDDPRCRIRAQVTNGVFTRAALLTMLLGLEVKGE